MVVLVVVAVVCFIAGSGAAAQWLPELLDDGPIGLLVSFVVCGLVGASLAVAAIYVDLAVRELERPLFRESSLETQIIGRSLTSILINSGSLLAFALIAYLLAPKARRHAPEGASPSAGAGGALG